MEMDLTEAQAAKVNELEQQGDGRVYTYSFRGDSVVAAFRRYLETDDPTKITASLREFLMGVCGFIAHYDLHGFRHSYPHAHLLLAEMNCYSGLMSLLLSGHRMPERVYRDGMTDAEVCQGIAALVETHRVEAERNYARAVGEKVMRQVIDGARILEWAVVPSGFTVVPMDQAGDDGLASADAELQRLADARGLRLVPESQLF